MSEYSPAVQAVVDTLMHTDAYKLSHRTLYPPGTTRIYSNFTNRRSRMSGVDKVVHFGLQAYIQRYLMDAFEPVFTGDIPYPRHILEVCNLYHQEVTGILGPDAANIIGTDHIRDLLRLGYLPLRFCALPEGTLVPIGVPSFTVENTHPDFAWLTNYIETGLSAGIWQAQTSATIAHEYRKILDAAAQRTGADPADVDYQCHDFSYRGMSSHETAAVSGAAHLLSFSGSDSLIARRWIKQYYGGPFVAESCVATEHSVMSAGTAVSSEYETFERILDTFPTGTVAIVSDTYDLWRVITEYLPKLKDKILARDGKLVIRPDSGNPIGILLGDDDIVPDPSNPAYYGVVNLLANIFGTTGNSKGFRRLDPHIGDVYGDSITLERAGVITTMLEEMGFESTSVGLGVGSFSYQYNTRDTFSSAMKATWAEVDGKGVNLFKDPVTDDGTKKSATGRLAVFHDTFGDRLELVQQATPDEESDSLLQPVWVDGKFVRRQSFEDVRKVLNGD